MTFDASLPVILFTSLAALGSLVLSVTAWRRSGYRQSTGKLEMLRLSIVTVAILTLLQPEFVTILTPQQPSTVVVLRDCSGSMQTRDHDQAAEATTTRWDATRFLEDKNWLSKIAGNTRVVVEPFSFEDHKSDRGTDINAALKLATSRHQDLMSIVLVSDGDWNTGQSPAVTAQALRLNQTPVHTVCIGQPFRQPDIGITGVDVPAIAVVGKPLRIPFQLESTLATESDVPVTLTNDAGDNLTQVIRLPAKGTASGTFEFRPKQAGDLSLVLSVAPGDVDSLPDNNSKTIALTVRTESLKVLVVESYPRWEYRYIRNALERDPGIDVDCLLFHPELAELGAGRNYLNEFPADNKLYEYDVVFLGDVGLQSNQTGGLTDDQCRSLRNLVQSHGGGLVFIPGLRGSQSSHSNSRLAELLPIEFDSQNPRGIGSEQAGHFQLTELGRSSLLTRLESNANDNEQLWKSLPGFHWHAGVLRAKPGSQVLATHDSSSSRVGRRPLIVTRTFGNGKVLFIATDGAWRWRKGVEDRYHYRFWGQVVRWMAYQRNLAEGQSLRLIYSPERPKQDEAITFQVNAISTIGEPLESGTVTAQITTPNGASESIQFQSAPGESWGLFTAGFRPREGGVHQVKVSCRETGAELETTLPVVAVDRELVGRPSRPEVLKEIATITGGKSFTSAQISELAETLNAPPQVATIEKRVRLWCHPLWGGLTIVLLSLFWGLRKLGGLA